MKIPLRIAIWLCAVAPWLTPFAGSAFGQGGATVFTVPTLNPSWMDGGVNQSPGAARVLVEDVNGDGIVEILSCAGGHAFALARTPSGTYETLWFSDQLACQRIATAPSGGGRELLILTEYGTLLVFALDDFSFQTGVVIGPDSPSKDVAAGDVDGDGELEVVVVREADTLVVDRQTWALEWQATGRGGTQVALGNVDADPALEIAINSQPGYILDAALQTSLWALAGGFGQAMDLGDLDGDGRADIAFAGYAGVTALAGDTGATLWALTGTSQAVSVRVADVDQSGSAEVLVGAYWGGTTAYAGPTGAPLWTLPHSDEQTLGLGVGDVNADGVNEIVWGAGAWRSVTGVLTVASWVSAQVLWRSDTPIGPFLAAAGDVDNDGTAEIVMTAAQTAQGRAGGLVRTYDAVSHRVESSTVVNGIITHVAIGQVDADPALEIVLGTARNHEAMAIVLDGVTLQVEWESAQLGMAAPVALSLSDLDADGRAEIVLATQLNRLYVFGGAPIATIATLGPLASAITDVAVGDVTADPAPEIVVASGSGLNVYAAGTLSLILQRAAPLPVKHVAIAPADAGGPVEVIAYSADSDQNGEVRIWRGPDLAYAWQHSTVGLTVDDLALRDLEGDGDREFILSGAMGLSLYVNGLLWIGDPDYPVVWQYKRPAGLSDLLGPITIADLDGDGALEVLLGGTRAIQVNDVGARQASVYRLVLPLLRK